MKTYSQRLRNAAGFLVGLASMCAAIGLGATGADNQSGQSSFAAVTVNPSAGAGGGASDSEKVVISSIEPTSEDKRVADKDGAWLGVSVEESSEALASQLGLAPGAGLVVTYVAADSPAAKAGLEKNDVLVELDGQLLLVPAQLRKLIEVRRSGATIKLVFYRAGKKQETSAALLKTPARFDLFEKGHAWDGKPGSWWDVVGNVKIDTAKIQEGVRRSVEEARKAMQEALRASTNAVGPAAKVLRELERELQRSRINLDNNASVTVRSTSHLLRASSRRTSPAPLS